MNILLTVLALAFSGNDADPSDDWFPFLDESQGLVGYKDHNGSVHVEPRFAYSFDHAPLFRTVIVAIERDTIPKKYLHYYLLKDGRRIGKDSLFMLENSFDCESEGRIRFNDPTTWKMGFIGAEGVEIPAMYSWVSKFIGGYTIAGMDGTRMCDGRAWTEGDRCEHQYWSGMTAVLLDESNHQLAVGFDWQELENADWNTLALKPSPWDPTYRSVAAKDGKTIYFRDNLRYLEKWLRDSILNRPSKEHVKRHLEPELLISRFGGWKIAPRRCRKPQDCHHEESYAIFRRDDLGERDWEMLIALLKGIGTGKTKMSVAAGNLPSASYSFASDKYSDLCGKYDQERFPYFEVSIQPGRGGHPHQLGFIRDDSGFKLIFLE